MLHSLEIRVAQDRHSEDGHHQGDRDDGRHWVAIRKPQEFGRASPLSASDAFRLPAAATVPVLRSDPVVVCSQAHHDLASRKRRRCNHFSGDSQILFWYGTCWLLVVVGVPPRHRGPAPIPPLTARPARPSRRPSRSTTSRAWCSSTPRT